MLSVRSIENPHYGRALYPAMLSPDPSHDLQPNGYEALKWELNGAFHRNTRIQKEIGEGLNLETEQIICGKKDPGKLEKDKAYNVSPKLCLLWFRTMPDRSPVSVM